jgi:multimeric flavodoxin WrbA
VTKGVSLIKTLIISGSPRKNGDSVAIVEEMRKLLEGQVTTVDAYRDNIAACTDCRYCRVNPACIIQDAMQVVYNAMEEADNIILSSPVHFSELSGKMLSLMSRLQVYYYMRRRREKGQIFNNKNGVLILTGGGDGGSARAQASAKIFFNMTNTNQVGSVLSLNTDRVPAKDDCAALKKARGLAQILNRLYREGKQSVAEAKEII